MLKLVFLLIACASLSQALSLPGFSLANGCPRVFPFMPRVDIKRMEGPWYAVYTPSVLRSGCSTNCWTLDVTTHDNVMTHEACCNRNGVQQCGAAAGSFDVIFDPNFSGRVTWKRGEETAPGYYLLVDYDHYVIGFVCMTLPDGTTVPDIYVYSRRPVIPKELGDIIKRTLQLTGITNGNAMQADQDASCNYSFRSLLRLGQHHHDDEIQP